MLRPEVFDVFRGVDHILHGGDVGKWDVVVELEALAPVTAVYGNTDGFELRSKLPQVATVELEGFQVVVTHGDQLGSPTPAKLHAAFPDIHFELQQIVIGPQGVCEEARVTGTHKGKWLSHQPTGQKVEFRVVILFPWDPQREKFRGERVFALL